MKSKLAIAATVVGMLGGAATANANVQWLVTDVGASLSATGINNLGQVVGNTAGGTSFLTGPNGIGVTNLWPTGTLANSASGINDLGQVVGTFLNPVTGSSEIYITGANGALPTSTFSVPGAMFISSGGINSSGQAVVASFPAIGSPSYTLQKPMGRVCILCRCKDSHQLVEHC